MTDAARPHQTSLNDASEMSRASSRGRVFPEGPLTYIVMVALVALAGQCVESTDWTRIMIPIAWVAAGSAMFGCLIARIRVLDSLAHLVSLLMGVVVAIGLVGINSAGSLEGGFSTRVESILQAGGNWYLGDRVDSAMEARLVSLLMALIAWLVGYLAAWALFRRGWLLAAILLPGFLILVNLAYANEPDGRFLGWYACLALMLIASHNLYARERSWRRFRLDHEHGLGRVILTTGVTIAIVSTIAGWTAPSSLSQSAIQPLAGEIGSGATSMQERMVSWIEGLGGTPKGGVEVSGSYTEFDSSFAVGGPLNLSDDPMVLVSGDYAPYLTAQSYDSYNGRGWSSESIETFDPIGKNGRRYAPEMSFGANQTVPLSEGVTGARTQASFDVTPIGPLPGRMLTVDTYLTSSVPVSVRMSWSQLDEAAFQIGSGDLAALPIDLQRLASLLMGADLTGESTEFGQLPEDAAQAAELDREREELGNRFLTVRWTASDSGQVDTLFVTGQTPNYDDIESVQPDGAGQGTYQVISSTSTASADELREAGSEYPQWVAQRYLVVPESTTPRTVEMATNIASTMSNPYDSAKAIEQYLRSTIVYDERVTAPPEDADIVDYVLFERQRGYCEYYASAMAVMLRSIGIPARVSVGFAPGDYDGARGGYVYRQANAHAWVEAYFPGYGWIPFEPTTSETPLDRPDSTPSETPEAEPTQPPPAQGESPTQTPLPEEGTPAAVPTTIPTSLVPEEGSGSGWSWFVMAGALAAGLVGLALWFAWTVPLRGLSVSGSLYARLRRVGRWLGVRDGRDQTPREFGERFSTRMPAAGTMVHRIVETYEVDQYAPDGAQGSVIEQATAAWQSLRRQVPGMAVKRRLRWRKSKDRS